MKFAAIILSGLLLLTGCSSSISEESATTSTTPEPAPVCLNREYLDQLSLKKINRNPSKFKGICGFVDIKILEIFPIDMSLTDRGQPSNCAVGASYTYPESDYPLDWAFDGIFFFSNCADYEKVFDGDVYKVLVVVDNVNTQNNGDQIAQFLVVETRVYEDFGDRLIG